MSLRKKRTGTSWIVWYASIAMNVKMIFQRLIDMTGYHLRIDGVKKMLCTLLSHENGQIGCKWRKGSTDMETFKPKLPDSCTLHGCRGAFREMPPLTEIPCFIRDGTAGNEVLTYHPPKENRVSGHACKV